MATWGDCAARVRCGKMVPPTPTQDRAARVTRLIMVGLLAAALVLSVLGTAGAATKTSVNLKLRGHLRGRDDEAFERRRRAVPDHLPGLPSRKDPEEDRGEVEDGSEGATETGSRMRLDLADRGGKYRAVVPRKGECLKGISAVATHRH